ncbi:hypothetical protein [Bifidobacterium longum]|uniref:hypothetical protein n=1 Tax=Bifidobacterium longum TaxID=216816 RepID=UPI0015CE4A51|nr:hypothetical protein [Bifidobacterium longum]
MSAVKSRATRQVMINAEAVAVMIGVVMTNVVAIDEMVLAKIVAVAQIALKAVVKVVAPITVMMHLVNVHLGALFLSQIAKS